MNGPHFKYLTNAYVEARGMEQFPVERREPIIACFPSDGKLIPVPYRAFDVAVVYNHGLYMREYDGLAWSRRGR